MCQLIQRKVLIGTFKQNGMRTGRLWFLMRRASMIVAVDIHRGYTLMIFDSLTSFWLFFLLSGVPGIVKIVPKLSGCYPFFTSLFSFFGTLTASGGLDGGF